MRGATFIALAAIPILFSSCYVTSQGLEYLGLLAKGRSLAAILADPATDEATKTLVRDAEAIEAFGRQRLGEKPTRNFQKLVAIDADTLVHVVQACAPLSFDRWLWNYPLVGKLPYKGYFKLADAEAEAARMRAKGLDVIVRNADAFSTLGWLSDPLWSFMSSYDEGDLADLILHELLHATAFRRSGLAGASGADNWNEGIATFVGREGSLLWLETKYGNDSKEVAETRLARKDAVVFASFLRETAKELETVYSSKESDDAKHRDKARIIAERAVTFSRDYSQLFSTERYRNVAMDRINNAWIDLYRLYEGDSPLFREWYEKISGSDLRTFISDMATLAKGKADPIAAMKERVSTQR